MNKTNRPAADTFPEDEEGDLPFDTGLKSSIVSIRWEDHEPRAYYATEQNPLSMGAAHGGRFRIEITPPATWKAFKAWVADPTANAGSPDGYWFSVAEDQGDAQPESAARNYDLSDPSFLPPYVFYVSSLRHEKRILSIQPYPEWDGEPAGTPLTTLTFSLTPPPQIEPVVTMERHDGSFSTRWRKITFSANPPDWRKQWGIVVGEVLTSTSFRSSNALFPLNSPKFKPGLLGRDVWLHRPQLNAGATFPQIPGGIQHQGAGQWRKITQVSNNGAGDAVITYEAPFDPPLSDDPDNGLDMLNIVDKCVMWRATATMTQMYGSSFLPGEFTPTLGTLFVDTWKIPQQSVLRNSTSDALPAPDGNNWVRRLEIEYYLHNAGYADDEDFEEDSGADGGYVDEVGATFPPTTVRLLTIRAQKAPAITDPRLFESQITSGKLRIEPKGRVGDVNTYRVYAVNSSSETANDWPTYGGYKYSDVDPQYFVGEYYARDEFAETDFTISGGTKVILVPMTTDGEKSVQRPVWRPGGPEVLPIIYNAHVRADDDPDSAIYNNEIHWAWNGAASDIANVFKIIHHCEHEDGIQHGENPVTVLYDGTSGAVPNPFTHDGSTPGAEIDYGRGASRYAVTHVYDLIVFTSDGLSVQTAFTVRKTDGFDGPRNPTMGTLHATLESKGSVDPSGNGKQREPVTVNVRMVGSRNLDYDGQLLNFQFSVDGLGNTDPSKVWKQLAGYNTMQDSYNAIAQRHQLWGYLEGVGGTSTPIVYRAYWGGLSDIIYSNVLTLNLITLPDPF